RAVRGRRATTRYGVDPCRGKRRIRAGTSDRRSVMRRRILLAIALSCGLSMTATAQSLNDSRLRLETWVSNLVYPTTFTWIGPGELFVFEKTTGKVKWYKDGTYLGTVLDLTVQHDNERGGLGIAADPAFATNHFVYVYWSATSSSSDSSTQSEWTDNRV